MRAIPAWRGVAAVLLLGGILGACSEDRASVLDPLGEPSHDFFLAREARGLPGGTVAMSTTAGTITVTIRNVEQLTSGFYNVWVAQNQSDTNITGALKARGHLVVIRRDTTFDQGTPTVTPDTLVDQAGISAFSDGGANVTAVLTIDAASLGSNPLVNSVVLVTIESDSTKTAPTLTGPRPLWRRFAANTTASGALTFGTFAPSVAQSIAYNVTGRGQAGIRGSVLVLNDTALNRPPVGYYIATFLVQHDADGLIASALSLGPQTAPYPRRGTSLYDADVQLVDQVVNADPPQIFAAATRVNADTLTALPDANPFSGFDELWVTLETKAGPAATPSPTVLHKATIPDIVQNPPAP